MITKFGAGIIGVVILIGFLATGLSLFGVKVALNDLSSQVAKQQVVPTVVPTSVPTATPSATLRGRISTPASATRGASVK